MKFSVRFISFILIITLLALSLSGCGGASGDAVIYYEIGEAPETIDPQLADGETELMLVRNLFEGLMRVDETGETVCALAESYDKNGLKYTFNLSKTAVWSNGDGVTADDFVFAFRRAVDPVTAAPFAEKLSSIRNADRILEGGADTSALGITAVDDSTLEIYLTHEDDEFLHTLTTAICMPCSREFFESCGGKYGLEKNSIITNGSYRLSKWNKESFAMRLYRSNDYFGSFTAKNSAVFLSKTEGKEAIDLLKKSSVNIAEIKNSDVADAEEAGLKTVEFNNICWVMTLSDSLPADIRFSFLQSVDRDAFANALPNGYTLADSFFPPEIFGHTADNIGIIKYDAEAAKAGFKSAVKKLPDKEMPIVTLSYYSDGEMQDAINTVVAHWQQNLGAYINITPTSSLETMQKNLLSRVDSMAIFPIYIDDKSIDNYVSNFGFSYSNFGNIGHVQNSLTSKYTLTPLAFQTSVIAYSDSITSFNPDFGNGGIDFAYVTKK